MCFRKSTIVNIYRDLTGKNEAILIVFIILSDSKMFCLQQQSNLQGNNISNHLTTYTHFYYPIPGECILKVANIFEGPIYFKYNFLVYQDLK